MLVKWCFLLLGLFFLALALLGVVLPGLPTTPFILLAAGCFSKSSTRLHNWLLNNRIFGPMIVDWQEHRAISRRVRNIAISSMFLMGGASVFFIIEALFLQLLVASIILAGSYFLMQIRLTESVIAPTSD